LEAFETLLEKDFRPERTILAGFGFDEEISGPQGARFISKHLEDTKGKDSIDLIIDDGGLGIKEINGATFALPGLGEKGKYGQHRKSYYSTDGCIGYFDVKVTAETEGGHSSVLPDHTGVGILSKIISAIEGHPYEPELTPVNRESPAITQFPNTSPTNTSQRTSQLSNAKQNTAPT
jgi:Gly-Xaa carboxypeptidase